MASKNPVVISGHGLTIDDVVEVARCFRAVKLDPAAAERIKLCRQVVNSLVEQEVKVYGLTTGFASLRDVTIDANQAGELSRRLIISHSAGVGKPFPEDIVRAAMLLRAQALAQGCSGVRLEVVELLLAFLNARIYPYVPSQGSCGSSGDLAPLSHLVMTMIAVDEPEDGQEPEDGTGNPGGRVYRGGDDRKKPVRTMEKENFVRTDCVHAELKARLPIGLRDSWPLRLRAKEGLALNNGAVFCGAMLALAVADAEALIETSEHVAALSFEAIQAVRDCLDPDIAALRANPGHIKSAEAIRSALDGSELVPAHAAMGINMARLNRVLLDLRTLEEDCAKRKHTLEKLQELTEETRAELSDISNASRAASELREPTCSVYGEIRTRLETYRAEATKARMSYPKQQELDACGMVLKGCLKEWRDCLQALPLALVGHKWCEKLRGIHRNLADVVPASPNVQDNYSFRAAATVIGTARDTLDYVKRVAETEVNSATDNPLILLDRILEKAGVRGGQPEAESKLKDWLRDDGWREAANAVLSAANFHGQPVGTAADQLKIAISELGNIAERRIACLTDKTHSKGLPSYLVWKPGLNSGFMIPQYTAASLVAENRAIAFPASTDSVPTGEGTEDHTSMATTACRYCQTVIENVVQIIAIEALSAYQGVQFRKPARLGTVTGALEEMLAQRLGGTVYPDQDLCRKRLSEWGLPPEVTQEIRACFLTDQAHDDAIELVADLIRCGELRAGTTADARFAAALARYSDPAVVATYLEAEWGDFLETDEQHDIIAGDVGLLPIESSFYQEAAAFVRQHVPRAERILEAGAGTGRFCYEWLRQRGDATKEYLLCDLSPVFIGWARRFLLGDPEPSAAYRVNPIGQPIKCGTKQPSVVNRDVVKTFAGPLEDLEASPHYDLVVAMNVLDRHPTPAHFVDRLRASMCNGARIVLATPMDWKDSPTHEVFQFDDLGEFLEQQGLRVLARTDLQFPFRHARRVVIYRTSVVIADNLGE